MASTYLTGVKFFVCSSIGSTICACATINRPSLTCVKLGTTFNTQHTTFGKIPRTKKIDVRLNSIAPEMCISAQDQPGHRKTGLEFHFRYAENGRQTCAAGAPCIPIGKNCVAFFINSLAQFSYVSRQMYISG